MTSSPSWFHRYLLPGFAFKAVVIGGGYATGRELVSFFMPSGPVGGLYGLVLAMAIWSAVCTLTFLLAVQTGSRDYRTFFRHLLGRGWPVFEIAYCLAIIVILAVFAAAAGAIGNALFGWPDLAGTLVLVCSILLFAALGNEAVEQLFKYVTFFLYGTYAVFLALSLSHFGSRIQDALLAGHPTTGWAFGGATYAGYNIVGAVIVLPVTRHLRGRKDAVVAGLLAGPLALLPAILFFVCMTAFYPEIQDQLLPSDFLLSQMGASAFRFVFQAMIFAALLESGTGFVHAINERVARVYEAGGHRRLSGWMRLCITLLVLTGSIFVAARVGLVALIADGYRWLAYLFLTIYVLPLVTLGLLRIVRGASFSPSPAKEPAR